MMPDAARLLEIRVGEHAGGVGEGDELGGHLRWERLAPEEVACGSEPHTSGTKARRVVGADAGRRRRNDLGQSCRSSRDAAAEQFEVVKSIANVLGDADAVFVRPSQGVLEGVKETSATGNSEYHAAEFADGPMPIIEADPLLVAERIKDLE